MTDIKNGYDVKITFDVVGPDMSRKNTCEWIAPTRAEATAITAAVVNMLQGLTKVDVGAALEADPSAANALIDIT